MKLLVTAFDPFGGEKINPALEAVARLSNIIEYAQIVKLTVPTVFGKSIDAVTAAIERERVQAVLMIGQAGGRAALTPERVAINVCSARIADNEGQMPFEEFVQMDGPAAYFSTLPILRMEEEIKSIGLPAYISNTAGTFVCNQLMYGVLYYLEKWHPAIKAGFMHVPFAPEQVAASASPAPSMSIDDITRGITAAIRAIVKNTK